MWRLTTIVMLLATCWPPARTFAQEIDLDQKLYGASRIPDRVVLSWSDDPTTTMSVSWRTDVDARGTLAEIAVAEDGPGFIANTWKVQGESEVLDADLGSCRQHSVVIGELKPDTTYVYRVGDNFKWSEWCQFKTAGVGVRPFTFVYFGDSQNDLRSHWSRVARTALMNAPEAAFMIHAGDLVNRADADREWGEWFEAGSFTHRHIPCLAAPGNHEYKSTDSGKALSKHWRPTFAFPMNGPESLPETAYYFDHQGARFIMLNSNEQIDEQAEWLKGALSGNEQRWTILTFHHPVYSASVNRDNRKLRDAWQPIFDEFKVDLVLTGHDHTYARSGLMRHEVNLPTGAEARESTSGTVYVVSVSGPKMYDARRPAFMHRVAEDTQLFQIITINGDELYYQARTPTGKLYDGFTLKKQDDQPNQLVNKIPNIPERLRSRNPAAAEKAAADAGD